MRFNVNLSPTDYWNGTENTEIVFHGINKSGSLAMESVLREAFCAHDRSNEIMSHYEMKGSTADFIEGVNKRKSKLVVGHYLFNALKVRPERIWVTQFRHPLPRLLSAHNWLKLKFEKKTGGSFVKIKEFIIGGKGVAHSLVIQFGAGWGTYGKSRRKRLTPRDLYEISIDTLESQIHTIGLAERFEESIFMFAHLCDLSSVLPWIRDNRNPGRLLASEISDEDRDLIEEIYEFDFKLYDYAVSKFNQQLLDIGFDDQLAKYKDASFDQYKDRIIVNNLNA